MKKCMLFLAGLCVLAAQAANIDVTDALIEAGESKTMTADNVYILKELVYVEEGATLTIEPGTVIKADATAALIICKGAKIMAEGTKENPIIFTSVEDDLSDINVPKATDKGLWGGIFILGKARIGFRDNDFYAVELPDDPRRNYGGTEDDDNSGVLKYVSICYAGREYESERYMAGLTLAGVGNGTTLEYVEVYCSKGNGFYWLGGTVNGRYLSSVFAGGKVGFYSVFGFRGRLQYLFCLLRDADGVPSAYICAKHRGTALEEPRSVPVVSNATFSGRGGSSYWVVYERNAGGIYVNSVFWNAKQFFIESLADKPDESSWELTKTGELMIANNILRGDGQVYEYTAKMYDLAGEDPQLNKLLKKSDNYIPNNNDVFAWWQPTSLKPGGNSQDFRVALDTALLDLYLFAKDTTACEDEKTGDEKTLDTTGFIEQTYYKGAFDPYAEKMWIDGWTELSRLQYLTDPSVAEAIFSQEKHDSIKAVNDTLLARMAECPTGIYASVPAETAGNVQATLAGKQLTITLSDRGHSPATVELFDLTGKALLRRDVTPTAGVVDLRRLPVGNYILKIQANGKRVQRVISLMR